MIFCTGSIVAGQQRIAVSSNPSCPKCRIDLVKLFSIGGSDDTIAYDQFFEPTAVGDKRGRIFVAPTADGSVLVFSTNAQLIRRIGRQGKGPGEFESLMHIEIGPGDSLHVFDYGGSRASVFTPDLKYTRSTQSFGAQRFQHVILPGGEYFMYASANKESDSLLTLHSASGKILRRFPPVWRRLADPYGEIQFMRVLTHGGERFVWVGRPDRYELERWNTDGRIDLVLERRTGWWTKPTSAYPYFPREKRPEPILKSVFRDAPGQIWTVIGVSKPNWKQLDRSSGARHRQVMSASEHQKYFDTVIEVIDPQSGTLVASRRLPFVLQSIRTGNIAIGLREDADGNLVRDIYRVGLRRP
jgi:hypothetical protein